MSGDSLEGVAACAATFRLMLTRLHATPASRSFEWYIRSMATSVRVVPKPRSLPAFNGVKIFSATMFAQREQLGETVTRWLAEHPEIELIDLVVTQSSDDAFHCIAISVFYFTPADGSRGQAR
jgi:hypothetical protein